MYSEVFVPVNLLCSPDTDVYHIGLLLVDDRLLKCMFVLACFQVKSIDT